jgi:serine phosphatase RsbU (regulator of sigma subunit)
MARALNQYTSFPAKFVSQLNHLLSRDIMDQVFTLSYLILKPLENQIVYITCGFGNLWSISAEKGIPQKLESENIALGIDPTTELTENIQKWNLGDTLILSSLPIFLGEGTSDIFPEDLMYQSIVENVHFPPQKQADNILRKIKMSVSRSSLHSLILINVQRIR